MQRCLKISIVLTADILLLNIGRAKKDSTKISSNENFILSLFALYYKLPCTVLNIFSNEIIFSNTNV